MTSRGCVFFFLRLTLRGKSLKPRESESLSLRCLLAAQRPRPPGPVGEASCCLAPSTLPVSSADPHPPHPPHLFLTLGLCSRPPPRPSPLRAPLSSSHKHLFILQIHRFPLGRPSRRFLPPSVPTASLPLALGLPCGLLARPHAPQWQGLAF